MVTAASSRRTNARLAGAGAGLLADKWLGEPPAPVHPVALFGKASARLERLVWADSRLRGAGFTVVAVGGPTAAAHFLGRGRGRASQFIAVTTATWSTSAGRMLGSTAMDIGRALDGGELAEARRLLPSLVGRDPTGLTEEEIARAVVESVAENTVDAVVAPALWAAVGGASGAVAHRAVNTLDAMVGHRSARHAQFGWASARLDDLAAWVPARLTAVLVAAVRPSQAREVWRCVRRQAPAHPSPNAGVAEAAFAAALGLTLGGTNRYGERVEHRALLGNGRAPDATDIAAAVRLSRDLSALLGGALLVAARLFRPRVRRLSMR